MPCMPAEAADSDSIHKLRYQQMAAAYEQAKHAGIAPEEHRCHSVGPANGPLRSHLSISNMWYATNNTAVSCHVNPVIDVHV